MFYRVLIRGKPKAELGPLLFHFLHRLFQREFLTGGSTDFLQPADREIHKRVNLTHSDSHCTEQHGFTNKISFLQPQIIFDCHRSALLVWILWQSELHHLEEWGVLVRLNIKSHCITDLISAKKNKLHSSKRVNATLMVTINNNRSKKKGIKIPNFKDFTKSVNNFLNHYICLNCSEESIH